MDSAGTAAPAIEVVRGDITLIRVDAVVNAANSSLLGGGGVDGAIHRAGGPAILAECRALRRTTLPDGLPAGQAVATTAGDLPARWVIHTVGPVHSPTGGERQAALLRSCYASSLAVADRLHARTVSFPLVSAGAYGWPVDDAVAQAVEGIRASGTAVGAVTLVAFDEHVADLMRRALA
ncbi:O-acetyl-ADP-ribose deacetylase [Tomitella fengzijianii]|uniref:O-acetyl-ADP-ribose deacetylase n=1 Tax=Tomitella fengzijianii TaxID=2597660 RepID=A0A516X6G2_9ACTN|nr:O-acetyl-ADP-ribose deacetylase [Tomitella fengzijianii]QDQ98630.1 O-acetyl-ADP-ribose deacetylase [Tomitella fengzijianii]